MTDNGKQPPEWRQPLDEALAAVMTREEARRQRNDEQRAEEQRQTNARDAKQLKQALALFGIQAEPTNDEVVIDQYRFKLAWYNGPADDHPTANFCLGVEHVELPDESYDSTTINCQADGNWETPRANLAKLLNHADRLFAEEQERLRAYQQHLDTENAPEPEPAVVIPEWQKAAREAFAKQDAEEQGAKAAEQKQEDEKRARILRAALKSVGINAEPEPASGHWDQDGYVFHLLRDGFNRYAVRITHTELLEPSVRWNSFEDIALGRFDVEEDYAKAEQYSESRAIAVGRILTQIDADRKTAADEKHQSLNGSRPKSSGEKLVEALEEWFNERSGHYDY